MAQAVLGGGLVIWAAAIAWGDWQRQRIPNLALVMLLVPALLVMAISGKGLLGVAVLPSLLGLLLAGAILLPGYVLGKMGAGDVKFAACMGLLIGPLATVKMLLMSAMALGLLSVAVLFYYYGVPGNGRQRKATGPALALGFIIQLFWDPLSWSAFK